MDLKSDNSKSKLALLSDDITSESSKRFKPYGNISARDEPSFNKQRICRFEGTEPD